MARNKNDVYVAKQSYSTAITGEEIYITAGKTRVTGDSPLVAALPSAWERATANFGVEDAANDPAADPAVGDALLSSLTEQERIQRELDAALVKVAALEEERSPLLERQTDLLNALDAAQSRVRELEARIRQYEGGAEDVDTDVDDPPAAEGPVSVPGPGPDSPEVTAGQAADDIDTTQTADGSDGRPVIPTPITTDYEELKQLADAYEVVWKGVKKADLQASLEAIRDGKAQEA